ncbi:nucleoside/nucleotide kinase family protein [Paraoerskovia marina]|uniref:nucleoside/nucleotide kinase family protein n=1 Tax=Paraoerskovia marina TaxID=545619 RepID=UPI00049272B8|nr:nucleoside/nucleotide kinase family protein [Paraoerskovia marina]
MSGQDAATALAARAVMLWEAASAQARDDGDTDPVRIVIGIVGAPGSGKSTLAEKVVEHLEAGVDGGERCPAVVVPMDGFHLADAELERLGRRDRKGAPDTFDAEGFGMLLLRARAVGPGGAPVYAPEFRREIEEPVAGAIAVTEETRVVVTEGNYLLLDSDDGPGEVAGRWSTARLQLTESWFVEVPDDVRRARLVARHAAYGLAPVAAAAKALGPDEQNARLVETTRERASLVVRLDG